MSDSYTDPNGVVITIPKVDSLAERKAWFEGAGAPVQPDGYADMAADDAQKVSYDESVATNTAQIAEVQALIDAE
jgi:hypothetical protein|tara:strand:- start:948 stop:1172 length:225 start_codon:yes stop_codon:yes gene_type:complete